MSNIVSIRCTCDYLVKRAARHRRAGRYDEAMALLWKARNQFGYTGEILNEMARIYEEIGCEEEAVRAYLRQLRFGGKYRAYALFQLSICSAQHGDMQRAISYFDHLSQMKRQEVSAVVSDEMLNALALQLQQEISETNTLSPRKRAKSLEKHAAARLQEGKAAAAQRAMQHALRLHPTARGYTMLSCCQLIRMRFEEAVVSAQMAHNMSPGNVQTLCVLADAHLACGNVQQARRTIYLAVLRARETDELLSVAVECAKLEEDALTLLLTGRILKGMPFHTRAMMLRACACINLHLFQQARRLLGRMCGLLPENTVCESYFKYLNAATPFSERLTLGLDVTREEGVSRASELVSALYADPKEIDNDQGTCLRICRLADWAFHSPMAGSATKTFALLLLSALQSCEAKNTLLDLLVDPQISDTLKLHTLQILTAKDGFYPYEADIGGKLVRLAAGGITEKPLSASQANTQIVQRVADALAVNDTHVSQLLLKAYLAYLNTYGHPDKKHEACCSAALECWYHIHCGHTIHEQRIANRYGVTARCMRIYVRRFESCLPRQKQPYQGE